MTPEPDLAGFADAQERLRDAFGELVVFLRPTEVSFPPGTPLDPETQRPFDPTVEPTASGQASAVVECNVVERPFGAPDVEWTALGPTERDHAMFICSSGAASGASGAVEARVRGTEYSVNSQRFDGVAGIQRYLTFARRKG